MHLLHHRMDNQQIQLGREEIMEKEFINPVFHRIKYYMRNIRTINLKLKYNIIFNKTYLSEENHHGPS